MSDLVFLIDTPLVKIRECFSTYMQVIKRDVHFTYIRSHHCAVRVTRHYVDIDVIYNACKIDPRLPALSSCMCSILVLALSSCFSEGKSLITKALIPLFKLNSSQENTIYQQLQLTSASCTVF